MTKQQEILIEDNITFAYWKARQWEKKQKFIDGEELDSIALYALTQAAISYDTSKSNFMTYASRAIEVSFMFEIRKLRKEKAAMDMVTTNEDCVTDVGDYDNTIDAKMALGLLDPLHKQILMEYHVEGYSMKEIAEKYSLKQSQVDSIIKEAGRFMVNKCK